jgi:hypothetical protein
MRATLALPLGRIKAKCPRNLRAQKTFSLGDEITLATKNG